MEVGGIKEGLDYGMESDHYLMNLQEYIIRAINNQLYNLPHYTLVTLKNDSVSHDHI